MNPPSGAPSDVIFRVGRRWSVYMSVGTVGTAMSDRCSNCDRRDGERVDLLLRGDEPTEGYLCDPCREAVAAAIDIA